MGRGDELKKGGGEVETVMYYPLAMMRRQAATSKCSSISPLILLERDAFTPAAMYDSYCCCSCCNVIYCVITLVNRLRCIMYNKDNTAHI